MSQQLSVFFSLKDIVGNLYKGKGIPHLFTGCDMKFINDYGLRLLLIGVAKSDGNGNFISPAIDLQH